MGPFEDSVNTEDEEGFDLSDAFAVAVIGVVLFSIDCAAYVIVNMWRFIERAEMKPFDLPILHKFADMFFGDGDRQPNGGV